MTEISLGIIDIDLQPSPHNHPHFASRRQQSCPCGAACCCWHEASGQARRRNHRYRSPLTELCIISFAVKSSANPATWQASSPPTHILSTETNSSVHEQSRRDQPIVRTQTAPQSGADLRRQNASSARRNARYGADRRSATTVIMAALLRGQNRRKLAAKRGGDQRHSSASPLKRLSCGQPSGRHGDRGNDKKMSPGMVSAAVARASREW